MFNHPEAKNLVITPTYSTAGGSQLTVAVSGSMDTSFMKIMGFSSLNIGSTSTVKWGMNRLRVALALDNTGSMNDAGKIGALKTATKNLLTQLKNAATKSGDVYVSIIPFSRDVNVSGIGDHSSDWIRFKRVGNETDSWNDNNGTCSDYSGWSQPRDRATCKDKGGKWKAANHNTWNGCVMDRDQDYDVTNNKPNGQPKLFPAEQYASARFR